MSDFTQIRFTTDGAVAWIELSNAATRNALSERMRDEVLVACDVVESRAELRCVVLTGAGGDFSSGADLREFGRATSVAAARATRRCRNVYRRVLTVDCPTVAVIEGFAVGGGLELALSCDVRIAVVGSRLGLPEVRRGFIPGGGGTQLPGRRAGSSRGSSLVIGARLVDAEDAGRLGLVQEVHPTAEEAIDRASALAADLASLDRNDVRFVKRRLLQLS